MVRGRRPGGHAAPRVVGLAVVLLLLGGCGQPLSRAMPTATSTMTATPTPVASPLIQAQPVPGAGLPVAGTPLAWQRHTFPQGFQYFFHLSDVAIFPGNGEIAYTCDVLNGDSAPGPARLFATHDGGSTWVRAGTLPVAWRTCGGLLVDEFNPDVLIAHEGLSGSSSPGMISRDAGATWQQLPAGMSNSILQFASRGTSTYALVSQSNATGATLALTVSVDSMATWRIINGAFATERLKTFWLESNSNAVVAQAANLWRTTDDGAHWAALPQPRFDAISGISRYGSPGQLCYTMECTLDAGQHWTAEPTVFTSATGAGYASVIGLAPDGSLVASAVQGAHRPVFRLPAGGKAWQSIGQAPRDDGPVNYFPSPGGGVLWNLPALSTGAGGVAATDTYYTARYR